MSTPVSIIQQFLHPPIGLLVLEALPANPYSGLNGLQRIRGPINVDAFGIRWQIVGYPAGYGVTPRAGDNQFDRPVIEVAVQHQLLDSTLVVTEQSFFDRAAGHVLFNESFPYIIDVELAPGITADLFWLLAL